MYKKGIAWILALMLALGIAPGVFAAEEENGDSAAQPKYYAENPDAVDDGNLYMNKQLTVNKDGTGVITLESYVKGSVATSSKPTDIVLVLDQSGSMAYKMGNRGSQTKLDMLKSAAKAFVTQIRDDNKNLQDGQKHRIAIVGFGSEEGNGNNSEILTLEGKNSGYGQYSFIWGWSEHIGKRYQDLSSTDYQNALVNSDNTIVDNAISALAANGATRTDLGMTMAQKVLAQDTDATRNKVVVMFTDGVPTSSDSFDNGVANKTIDTAKTIKDSKASVYTVGLFDKAPSAGTNVDKFMNYVSSNYPKAQDMNTSGDKAEGSNYYRVAKDANSLKDIFESISQEVQNTTLNETSIIQDVLSQYVDADPAGEITCQVSTYDGTGFGTPAEAPEAVKATIADKKISVTGFDFKPVIAGKAGGQKLIIQIPVKINAQAVKSAVKTATMPSNVETESGIYHAGDKVGTFNTPKLVTLKAEGGDWNYNGKSHPATAVVKGGEGYTIQYSTNGKDWSETAPSVTNVIDGPLTVYARALKDGNAVVYAEPVTLKISPKLIKIKVNNAEKFFGQDDPAFTGSIIEGELVSANDLGTISYTRTNEAEAVGTYLDVLTADYTENSNYDVTIEKGDFTIKTAQSPATAALTLSGGEWTYDGDAHPATAQVTGAEGYTILYSTDEENWRETAPSVKDVDDGTVTVYARAEKEGYTDLETAEATLKINPRTVTLTSGSADKIYDGTALTKNEVTAGQEGFVKNEGFTYSTSGSQTAAGSSNNDFTYTLKDNTKVKNYTIKKVAGTLTVNPAPLTVKADDKVKHQGEDNPQLTGTITGFVNGETSDVLKGDVQYSTTAEKDSPVGTYPIKAGGTLEAQNYVIQYVDGTLTVMEKGAIIDNDPTQDQTTQTGDGFQIWLIAGIALLALAGAGTVIFTRRRKAD